MNSNSNAIELLYNILKCLILFYFINFLSS